jgi:hypothetical protein
VSSTVNTLFLAYVGASLPLMLLFVLSDQSPLFVANREFVATEIVRALVGSIGLVASVPLTTGLAAYCLSLATDRRPTPTEPPGEHEEAPDDPSGEQPMSDEEDIWIPERRIDLLRKRRR